MPSSLGPSSSILFAAGPADRHALFFALFCARNLGPAASTNRRLPLWTFGSCPSDMHHNSPPARMARIIVQADDRHSLWRHGEDRLERRGRRLTPEGTEAFESGVG